jgi:hypothetical protein
MAKINNIKRVRQLTLPLPAKRGRPKLSQKERNQRIWHRSRPTLPAGKPLHVTLKSDHKSIATFRKKIVYKEIRAAMKRARLLGVRIVAYTVQRDHLHLLLEANNSLELGNAMRAMSISLSKRLSFLNGKKLKVFKQRYHLHILNSLREIRHAIKYIFSNGKKHGATNSHGDWYSSQVAAIKKFQTKRLRTFVAEVISSLDPPTFYLLRRTNLY